MLESTKIQIRLSALRESVMRCKPDEIEKFNGLRGEVADAERDYRSAVESEQVAPRSLDAGESRAAAELHGRASCRAIIDNVLNDRQADGAEQEAQRAAGLNADGIPWAMLAEPELRVDADAGTPSTIGTTQRPVIDRVFARSALSALGVAMPSAAVGDEVYYVTTAGADGAYASGSTAVDAGPFTLNPIELKPKRLSAGYLILQENLQRIKGYEPALRSDLRNALSNRADAQNLGAGDSVQRGFLATPNQGGIGARAAATDDVTYDLALSESAKAIDGIYANMCSELSWIVGDDTYRKLAAIVNAGSGETFIEHATKLLRRIRASANIPAPAADAQFGIIAKMGASGPHAVMPIWGGGARVIRDEITKAAEGQVRLTILAFHSFKVLRADAFERTSLKIA